MGSTLRVLLMVHPAWNPLLARNRNKPEYDVLRCLARLGHQVEVVCINDDLIALEKCLCQFKPHVAFNLLEEFRSEGVLDFSVISHLEARGIAYTGCNPRGLIISRNKFVMSAVAEKMGILVPKTGLVNHGGKSSPNNFPQFLKYNREHASFGITQASVVRSARQKLKQIERLKKNFSGEILRQAFIPGREVSVSVWGNRRGSALGCYELKMNQGSDVASGTVKFSSIHRRKKGIRAVKFKEELSERLCKDACVLFGVLDLSGYARFDFRVTKDDQPYLIDVNANPNLGRTEDFAQSAKAVGFTYEKMIQRILKLAEDYCPRL